MTLRAAAGCFGLALLGTACRAPQPFDPAPELARALAALRGGQVEIADGVLQRLRRRAGGDPAVAEWSALVAEFTWDDAAAARHYGTAIRLLVGATAGEADPRLADLRGRLGELLFRSGRHGEAVDALRLGAVGAAAERRLALAALAERLPHQRGTSGPLLTEVARLPGDLPEFLCGTADRQRPFAVDTGTSTTALVRSAAAELGVRDVQPAGTARDAAGRELPVALGVLERLRIGDLDLGAVPVLVVDDELLRLRDGHGGAVHVPVGVLGLDLVASFRLTLDAERESLVLELPRGLRAEESVPCVRAEGRCLVPVTVDDTRLWFVLDTGASHSSLTPAGLQALPGGTGRASAGYRRVWALGGSQVAVREVRSLAVRVSAAAFRDVVLPVVEREAGGELFPVHGVLGFDLLGRCRVVLDQGRCRVEVLR